MAMIPLMEMTMRKLGTANMMMPKPPIFYVRAIVTLTNVSLFGVAFEVHLFRNISLH
jgi:hypothetical protein